MAFWIILGILIISCVLAGFLADEYDRLPAISATLVFGCVIGAVIIGIGTQFGPQTQRMDHTWELRALVTKESPETHASASFFLGFGYAASDSTQVTSISYIQVADDGGATIQKSDIEEAVIYEDGDKQPRVEDWVTVHHSNPAFWPWDYETLVSFPTHRFHIPAGSILEQYEVTP